MSLFCLTVGLRLPARLWEVEWAAAGLSGGSHDCSVRPIWAQSGAHPGGHPQTAEDDRSSGVGVPALIKLTATEHCCQLFLHVVFFVYSQEHYIHDWPDCRFTMSNIRTNLKYAVRTRPTIYGKPNFGDCINWIKEHYPRMAGHMFLRSSQTKRKT